MKHLDHLIASLAVVCLMFAGSVGYTQARGGGGTSWEQFHPGASQHTSSLNLNRPEVLGHLQFSAGLFAHFVDDPLQTLSDDGESVESRIVDDHLKTEVGASIGLFDVLQLNVVVPVVPFQNGEGQAALGGGGDADGAYVSEIRTSVDVPLIRPSERGGFGLGISGQVFVPSGAESSFNSDETVHGGPTLSALWRTQSDFELLANLGFDARSRTQVRNFSTRSAIRWGVGTVLPFAADGRVAALGNVFGRAPVVDEIDEPRSDSFGGSKNPAEALLGLRADFTDALRVQAGGGSGISTGAGAPDFRLFASAHFRTGTADRGKPERSEPRPEPTAEPDPEPEPPRADEPSDRDGDGIPDGEDDCPDEPETFNGVDDEDGCPDEQEAQVKIEQVEIRLAQKINFDTEKDEIRVEQGPVLEDLAALLQKYPELTSIRIEGHADSRGTDEYNQKLSERRAAAVERFLVERGVDADRLETVGKGEREPIGDNRTKEGRWQNRRVDFSILEVDGEPVDAESVVFDRLVE